MKKIIIIISSLFIVSLFFAVSATWSGNPPATGQAYFDTATGHKYIKNQDGTYTEYSQKGKVLCSKVPNTLPLLVSGKYITPVTREHMLVYEKNQDNITIYKVLPAIDQPPEGWRCKQLVSSIDYVSTPLQAEGYSSPEEKFFNPANGLFK